MAPPTATAAAVSYAVTACPFLRAVAASSGDAAAAQMATRPLAPVSAARGPVALEPDALDSLLASFKLVHGGDAAPLPLAGARAAAAAAILRCPHAAAAAAAARGPATASAAHPHAPALPPRPAAGAGAPAFASMSFSLFGGLPDPLHFLRRAKRPRRPRKRPQPPPSSSSSSSTGGGGPPTRGGRPPGVASRAPPTGAARPLPPPPGSNDGGGGCPLRSWPVLGALIPLTAGGDVACPPAVVALRAAVARVPAVRALRPRPVWLKGGAVLAAGAVAAAPFGAARVHTRKFSAAWFAAVHATIPFVAALRQATALPRWALVLTLAGSVAGQFVGARLEVARLEAERQRAGETAAAARQPPRPRRCVGPVCVPAAHAALVVA